MRIIYGSRVLYDPASGVELLDVELARSLREAASLTFRMPRTHPAYGKIKLASVEPQIEVRDGSRLLMRGRAVSCDDVDDVGTVEYEVEGELAYLNDTAVRPYSVLDNGASSLAPGQPYDFFAWLVQRHNSRVEPAKQFAVGINQGHLLKDSSGLLGKDLTYPSTGKAVKELLLDGMGGFVRARYEGTRRYIDLLADTDGTAAQRIEFGANLLKFARTRDGSEVKSVCIPLGKADKDTGERLTVKKLSGTDADGYGRYEISGDRVVSVDMVAKIGYREAAVEFDAVEDFEMLPARAVSWLASQAAEIETVKVSAFDLSRIDKSVKPIALGDYVRITSRPHGYDSYMIVSRIVERPGDWRGAEYTFGIEGEDIGERVRKHAAQLNAAANKAYEKADSVDKIAQDAQKRADAAKADAGKAQADADAAKKAADEARRAAQEAQAEIERAYREALEAASKAEEAKKAADDATAVVTVIQRQVEKVEADASAAQRGADAAKAAADAAQAAADAANAAAEAARRGADDAKSDAKKAVEQAALAAAQVEAIKAEVADIAGDAAKVREEVASQLATIKSTLEADYARKADLAETVSSLRSEIERSAAGITAKVEQDYAKKTELTDVEAALEAKISLNAESITSTVGRVETVEIDATEAKRAAAAAEAAATEAKGDASKAASSAASAQSGADKAKADAAAAQAGADAAKAAADKALRDYEDLEIRAEATDADLAKAKESLDAAEKSAAEARARADAAKSDAGAAQAAADKAKADAAAASSAASAADAKAQGAKDAVDEMIETIPGTYATKSEVKQESDRITASVAETSKLGERVSTVEQTAGGLSVRIDEVSARVPNRNHILGSASLSASGLGSAAGSRKEYQQVNVGQSYMGLADGTEVTVSFDLELEVNTAGAWIRVYNSNGLGPKQIEERQVSFSDPAGSKVKGRFCVTTRVRDRAKPAKQDNFVEFYTDYGTSNWFRVSHLKMELGAKGTEWTAAPEDSELAANALEFNNAGLDVGNRTGGSWKGFRTRMAASALQVLDSAGTVLASYGASLIELGKNSASSVIKLCAGKGQISYASGSGSALADNSGMRMSSDRVSVIGDSKALMYSSKGSWDKEGSSVSSSFVQTNAAEGSSASVTIYAGLDTGAHTAHSTNSTRLLVNATSAYVGHPNGYEAGKIDWHEIVTRNGTAINVGNTTVSGDGSWLYAPGIAATKMCTQRSSAYPVYGAKIVYSNASGATGSVPLNETAANFVRIKVLYGDSAGRRQSLTIPSPNGKIAACSFMAGVATGCWWYIGIWSISGTAMTVQQNRTYNHLTSAATGANEVRIFQVVGYR